MNLLEYTLKLNDRMTAVLDKVGARVDSVSSKGRKMKDDMEHVNSASFGGIMSKLKGLAAMVGLGAAAGKSFKLGMQDEVNQISFEVLFGGKDSAIKMMDEIAEYSKKAYGKSAISQAVQLQSGFDIAQSEIMKNLKAIGNIAMGDTNKFNSLNLAFSQMSSTGQLMGQDLLQMINAGFNPLEQMTKTTGKSLIQLKEEMGKGLITANMVKQAFYDAAGAGGQYDDMINRIADSAQGLVNSALGKLEDKMINFYKWLEPYWKSILGVVNDLLDDPIATIQRLVDKATTAFPIISGLVIATTAAFVGQKVAILGLAAVQWVIAGLKSVLAAYEMVVFAVRNSTNLWTAAQWLLNVAMTANPVGVVVAAVTALIAVITYLIIKINGWGQAWEHTVNGAKLIFQAYVESVKLYFNTMVNGLMIGINKIKEGWYEFKEAVGIGNSSENQKMLAQINADTEARKKSIVDGANKVAELATQSKNEFGKAWNSLSWGKGSLADAINGTKDKLGIADASVAGMTNTGANPGSSVGKETANSISTGGSKTTHITINLGKLVETISISKDGFRESAESMRDMIVDELTRALTMSQQQ